MIQRKKTKMTTHKSIMETLSLDIIEHIFEFCDNKKIPILCLCLLKPHEFKEVHLKSIADKTITNVKLQHISCFSQLESLDLTDCKTITNVGLKCVSNLTQLKSLKLTGCKKTTDGGLKYISKLTQLKTLELCFCKNITDVGLKHISNLTLLEKLIFCCCNKITDVGLQYLSLKLTQLKTLNLAYCGDNITDVGLKYISNLTLLEDLTLYDCDLITNVGLTYIYDLTKLLFLDLSYCDEITEYHVPPQLKELYINFCYKLKLKNYECNPKLRIYS